MTDLDFQWFAPDGNVVGLHNSTPINVLDGWESGFSYAPISFIEDQVAGQPGARLREVRVGVREVDLPLHLSAASMSTLRGLIRTLRRRFDPTLGEGQLQVTVEDGTTRLLNCRYRSGLEGEGGTERSGQAWRDVLLTFRAVDPYFYGTDFNITTFSGGTTVPFFPIFPLVLSTSNILAEVVVTNEGDVDAWPVWNISGPLTQIVLRRLARDALHPEVSLTLTTTLLEGQGVTIDTRPGRKTVIDFDNVSRFTQLSVDSEFWSLPSGDSTVRVDASGSTSSTVTTLSFLPRFWGV